MENNQEICPLCNSRITTGFMGNPKATTMAIKSILKYKDFKVDWFCATCAKTHIYDAQLLIHEDYHKILLEVKKLMPNIPIISIHNPPGWEFEVLDLVTGRATIGTGAITEFTSTFTDFFGKDSKRHNEKIKEGEDKCLNQLRAKAIEMGGNAVVGVDVDYSEIGALKGMIMVCATGTAIRIKNKDLFTGTRNEAMNKLSDLSLELAELAELNVF